MKRAYFYDVIVSVRNQWRRQHFASIEPATRETLLEAMEGRLDDGVMIYNKPHAMEALQQIGGIPLTRVGDGTHWTVFDTSGAEPIGYIELVRHPDILIP
jgi:hypothetical protein